MICRPMRSVVLASVCVLGLAAASARAGSDGSAGATATGTATGTKTFAGGLITVTGGVRASTDTRLSQAQRDRIIAQSRATRARNMQLVQSRVPALRKLQDLRAWQNANTQRALQQIQQQRGR